MPKLSQGFPDRTEEAKEAELYNKQQADLKAVQEAEEHQLADIAAQQVQVAYTTPVVSSDVINSIIKWANYYNVSSSWLLEVASCESSYNQSATNYGYYSGGGNPHGIFQFLPQTFYGNGGKDYDSYDDQARVAAYMFSIGQSVQWECK